MGFLPSSISIDLRTTGSKPNIFGYKPIGLMVPEVSITQGKYLNIGCIEREQSRQDSVNVAEKESPSMQTG